MEITFRNEREILSAIARLQGGLLKLESDVFAVRGRVKTIEDRSGSVDPTINNKLDLILQQQSLLLHQGGDIMATAAQLETILTDVDAKTTAMATTLEAQQPILAEIDADLDALLTRGSEPISEALLERFTLHRDRLAGLGNTLTETSAKLTATAAKHPAATPEEPPVEEPPPPVA